jgi:hypothetical protein
LVFTVDPASDVGDVDVIPAILSVVPLPQPVKVSASKSALRIAFVFIKCLLNII